MISIFKQQSRELQVKIKKKGEKSLIKRTNVFQNKMSSFVNKFFSKLSNYNPDDRIKYIEMTIEKKRKEYRCKQNFNTLEGVKKWPDYYKDLRQKVESKLKFYFILKIFFKLFILIS